MGWEGGVSSYAIYPSRGMTLRLPLPVLLVLISHISLPEKTLTHGLTLCHRYAGEREIIPREAPDEKASRKRGRFVLTQDKAYVNYFKLQNTTQQRLENIKQINRIRRETRCNQSSSIIPYPSPDLFLVDETMLTSVDVHTKISVSIPPAHSTTCK